MKEFVYYLGCMWFKQFANEKVLGVSRMLTIVGIIALPFAIMTGYDTKVGLEVGENPVTLFFGIVWSVFLIGYVLLNIFTPSVDIKIQDKYWETQLVRFKDPKYYTLKERYPSWRKREALLESMWLAKYGVKFQDTEKPLIQNLHFLWVVVTATVGLVLGQLAAALLA